MYVVIVTWNGWRDTVECLESLLRSDYADYAVIICDNGSTDGTVERLTEWASGQLADWTPPKGPLHIFSWPPVPKPVSMIHHDEPLAVNTAVSDASVVIMNIGENRGFAGGANIGIKYALQDPGCAYVWLLNSDTVVAPDALSSLVQRVENDDSVGTCGSTLLYYQRPDCVQALGGAYYCPWLGMAWPQGWLRSLKRPLPVARAERWMNYIVGASLLVSRSFIEEVGFLSEDYFLYCEEVDWAIRARNRFSQRFAPDSIVYHKVGGSIGTSSLPGKKSLRCEFWSIRNRLFLTQRYFPAALPLVWLTVVGAALMRLLIGRWRRAKMIINLLGCYNRSVAELLAYERRLGAQER